MKKLLVLATAMFSYAASASVLLWLVDQSDATSKGITSWDTVKVTYGTGPTHPGDTTLENLSVGGQSADALSDSMTSAQYQYTINTEHFALADLAGIDNYAGQYYFIELYNNDQLVGYSTGVQGSSLTASIKEWSDLSNMTQSMTGWSASGFTAVPEPTSGMLMLLGMALLGLRRKKAV